MRDRRSSLVSGPPERLKALRAMTDARVALGRTGASPPTRAVQTFLLDHAQARQAVWRPLDIDGVGRDLRALGADVVHVASRAPDRADYLRRPDLGRALSDEGARALEGKGKGADVALVIADGLSATAVEMNAVPVATALLQALASEGLTVAPITLATQARVALGDDVGAALGAKVAVILIGERPGLSAADSLGAYVTFGPKTGLPDSRRNCISNIRDGGVSPVEAAGKIMILIRAMCQQETSGVVLIEFEEPVTALSG
ncbi:ethanolamine ammonia-lyase subunit EutC [Rhizobium sp. UGM030330-04]|uniref:ethanolamine ammonia-lyase subunit EutC n=1 Tax=Rhizobium sp. UGM030330-04 TaxID=1378077 RepID=UPI000D8CDE24|nr:ethanolamine ammonia-lyase subunit EutC [Rhizobium sp. UGM030330-04]PYG55196.1 ethanolamine ammonia-lyase light chain [Rhizobium sp. UGM030330-04]